MNRTYIDECLERAEKAFTDPPKLTHKSVQDKCPECKHPSLFDGQCINNFCISYYPSIPDRTQEKAYSEFIAHARTDVPELARRLKKAIAALQGAVAIAAVNLDTLSASRYRSLADELEAPLEEK